MLKTGKNHTSKKLKMHLLFCCFLIQFTATSLYSLVPLSCIVSCHKKYQFSTIFLAFLCYFYATFMRFLCYFTAIKIKKICTYLAYFYCHFILFFSSQVPIFSVFPHLFQFHFHLRFLAWQKIPLFSLLFR